MNNASLPRKISGPGYQYRFSIATLVTNMVEYQQMVSSFINAGFTTDICEYIYIDNTSENSFDAFEGINQFFQAAKGEYVVIAHQDVVVNFDGIDVLNTGIKEMDTKDPSWAILSNAGGVENDLYQRVAVHVVYGDGHEQNTGKFPKKVCSVDEHFIVAKTSANLALSSNLKGFHLYGTDLCLVAELLGYSAYVIDFKLTHKSYGNPDVSYDDQLKQLKDKYRTFMRSRTIVTTITDFRLSSSRLGARFTSAKFVKQVSRALTKLKTSPQDRKRR